MSNQPTILVKKADGTSVRMTLDEIKKMKSASVVQDVKVEERVEERPISKGVPLIIREKKVEETIVDSAVDPMPVFVPEKSVDIKVDVEAEAKTMLKVPELEPTPVELLIPQSFETHLLEETVAPHEVPHPDVVTEVSYDSDIKKIITSAKLEPTAELMSRYQSLLISYLKGVRSLDQIIKYAELPVDAGGLALDAVVTKRLYNTLASNFPTDKKPMAQAPKPVAPAAPLSNRPMSGAPMAMPTTSRPAAPTKITPAPNTLMRDVQAPVRTTTTAVMGPVEEMKNFSVRDWRRLATTPEKAKEIILNKFKSWKEESFFLYNDVLTAWFSSPLFQAYQDVVAKAINNSSRISDIRSVSGAAETLNAVDITALIEVNRSLNV